MLDITVETTVHKCSSKNQIYQHLKIQIFIPLPVGRYQNIWSAKYPKQKAYQKILNISLPELFFVHPFPHFLSQNQWLFGWIWERLCVKGIVPEGDWLNWAIKVTAKWNDHWSICTSNVITFILTVGDPQIIKDWNTLHMTSRPK